MTHPLHSSEDMTWQTPEHILERVRRVAPIALDPCTTLENPTKALSIYLQTAESCGLSLDWGDFLWRDEGLIFVNPPYGPYLSGPIEPQYIHTKTVTREPTDEEWAHIERCGYKATTTLACNARARHKKGTWYLRSNWCVEEKVHVGTGRGWAEKVAQAMESGLEVLMLAPTRTETTWWKRVFWASDFVCLGPRIPFVNASTGEPGPQPNHASTFFYSGNNTDRFCEVFSEIGIVVDPFMCKEAK